jgi:hypothetical protein
VLTHNVTPRKCLRGFCRQVQRRARGQWRSRGAGPEAPLRPRPPWRHDRLMALKAGPAVEALASLV